MINQLQLGKRVKDIKVKVEVEVEVNIVSIFKISQNFFYFKSFLLIIFLPVL